MRDYKLYISDILESIDKITGYLKGLDFDGFKNDSKAYDSILLNIFKIGEAASRIPEDIKEKYADIDWHGIIGMRNIIAHAYFNIDPDIIWKTAKDDLIELKTQIMKIEY